MPRSQPGAFVKGAENCADRIAVMVEQGRVESVSGKIVQIKADTVCVHGDNDEALSFVKTLKERLENLGFIISAVR